MQEVTDGQGQRQVSEEFQLLGKAFDNKLNYVAGLYYFNESGYVHDYVPFDTGYLYVYDYDNNIKTDSYAGYLHLDYKLTDAWGLTAGVRYSHEKKQFLGGQGDLNGFSYKITRLPGSVLRPTAISLLGWALAVRRASLTCQQVLGFPDPSNPLRYFPNAWDSQSWNVWTPTYGIQWHITPDVDGVCELFEGLQVGWLDHAPVRPDLERGRFALQSRVRHDLRTGPEVDLAQPPPAGQSRAVREQVHGHPAERPGRPVARLPERRRRDHQGRGARDDRRCWAVASS